MRRKKRTSKRKRREQFPTQADYDKAVRLAAKVGLAEMMEAGTKDA